MSNHQPFDLNKLDYEAIRRRNRRKLLLWSLAPVIIVFLVALWFILPMTLTHQAIGEYKHGNHSAARNWLTPLTWTSPDPFVIAFNSGTVDTKLGKYVVAESELSRALAIASKPRKCMAAQNLVASLQAHAKTLQAKPKEADAYNAKASKIIQENPACFKGSAAQGGGSSSSSSSSQSQSPTESQQQQLQQKEQEGRERQAQYARDETFNPDDPSIKRW